MSDFTREARYYVIKQKNLTEDQDTALCDLLSGAQIPCTDCVVVEKDWPNYEHTWQTIQKAAVGKFRDPYKENYGSLCRMGSVLHKVTHEQEPPMSEPTKFAKLYESETHGQILVKLDSSESDGAGDEIRYYFRPEGLGVCSCAIMFADTDAGYAAADRVFAETTAQRAEGAVRAAIDEHYAPFMSAVEVRDE